MINIWLKNEHIIKGDEEFSKELFANMCLS